MGNGIKGNGLWAVTKPEMFEEFGGSLLRSSGSDGLPFIPFIS
jgi:hypothetical protein